MPASAWLLALATALALALGSAQAAGASASWTEGTLATSCAAQPDPLVVFPAAGPASASGPGAILWSGGACGSAAGGPGVELATVGSGDALGPAHAPAGPVVAGGLADAVAGTTAGQVLAASSAASARCAATPRADLIEGRADGRFATPAAPAGLTGPIAMATAYLGDVAVASVRPAVRGAPCSSGGGGIELRIQRHFAARLASPVVISRHPGAVSAIAVALDYRSDALVAWEQGGSIYARLLRRSGRLDPLQRLGPSQAGPQIQALVSDDNRAIVAWSSAAAGVSRVFVDISGGFERFTAPAVALDRSAEPPGPGPGAGSLRLVRLSTEGVLLAWTSVQDGRYVVRVAPVRLAGVQAPVTVSDAAGDAVLSDLARGPRGDAVLVWTVSQRTSGAVDPSVQEVSAASWTPAGMAAPAPSQVLVAAGPHTRPRAAFDPTTDAVLVVWETLTPPASGDYALGLPTAP
jgi:hypothetical protein